MFRWLIAAAALIKFGFTESALAACATSPCQITIGTGVPSTVTAGTILGGIIKVLLMWSGLVTTAIFLLGCLALVGSAGSEQMSSYGKRLMKGSAIGLAIILGSWLILSTAVYLIAA